MKPGTSFSFYLKPFFYQTSWFYIVLGLVLLLMSFGIYRFRVRALTRRKHELESLVEQRTKELGESNRQLEEAIEVARQEREAAHDANRSKSEFLARMSHEIRTPMNGILGFADILMESQLKPGQKECVEIIARSGEALTMLINDILDLARIEAGELTIYSDDFQPEDIFRDVLEIVRPRVKFDSLEVSYRIGEEVPQFLKSDSGRFRQVLLNLVSNAVKFTQEGNVLFDMHIDSEDETGYMVHVRVKDTGIGIPQNRLGTIFESFRQADEGTGREYGGTGLGLAICKQIAVLMGGDVYAESEPGTGSTFHFTSRMEKSDKVKPAELIDKKENPEEIQCSGEKTNPPGGRQ